MDRIVTIRHWLPIVTFCPVNRLPDLIYISVLYRNQPLVELYGVRKKVRKLASWRLAFMEDIAKHVFDELPDATEVTVRLAFNRHSVTYCRPAY